MRHSEQIEALATALAKAQGQFTSVAKTGVNPFLNSQYITLDGIIEAIREPLSANGLAFLQALDTGEITTTLTHESGQWVSSTFAIPDLTSEKGLNDLQVLGKAITYIKRYALASLLGISAETDDDAAGAKDAKPHQRQQSRQAAPMGKVGRPMTAEQVREALQIKTKNDSGDPATDKQTPFVAQMWQACFDGESDPAANYHASIRWLWGVESAKELTKAQASATLAWLLVKDSSPPTLHESAKAEAYNVWRAAMADAGQQSLFDGDDGFSPQDGQEPEW